MPEKVREEKTDLCHGKIFAQTGAVTLSEWLRGFHGRMSGKRGGEPALWVKCVGIVKVRAGI